MATRILGASVWEQELYDHLHDHVEHERDAIDRYSTLAESTSSPAFAFLARLILADELHHHRLLGELAGTVRGEAELQPEPLPIPILDFGQKDRDEILDATEAFLEIERRDLRELKALAKEMRPVGTTTMWQLLVQLMEQDTVKHIHILEFIRDRIRHPEI
jgi:rubrerythrin